jgi:hypothetical protein
VREVFGITCNGRQSKHKNKNKNQIKEINNNKG